MVPRTDPRQSFAAPLAEDRQWFSGVALWLGRDRVREFAAQADSAQGFVDLIRERCGHYGYPEFVAELAALEAHWHALAVEPMPLEAEPEHLVVNPGLRLFANRWAHLTDYLGTKKQKRTPVEADEQVLVWPDPITGAAHARPAHSGDLLALKVVLEGLDIRAAAAASASNGAALNGALLGALEEGLILGPPSTLVRAHRPVDASGALADLFTATRVFALQWHITQACDLHCRHCYDRTPCPPLGLAREIAILDQLQEFCSEHHVFGQVTFTGGNPLLHPDFRQLYREASKRGFFIGILGNPAPRAEIEALAAIQMPAFYQMSLEGLEPHNDYIRGAGHYQRVRDSLEMLREIGIPSRIMLTLTRENLVQTIPLGRLLQGCADQFTFNRLSLVGEGANLAMAEPEEFHAFLEEYLEAAADNPVFDLKDNLFNIVLEENHRPLFGGCTGYGCGAAFNFVSVLANGEVHACRKFPSPIGDLTRQSLTRIYHSELAERYRRGPASCADCRLNQVCRGCLAATRSCGLDVFADRDPYCFVNER